MIRKRSTELWHIPKRGSIHQIVGALNIIDKFSIDGKPWPAGNRKLFDQKFAMWGFTTRGRSISKNASETLEALIKYLGLIIVTEGGIHITKAGRALIKEHKIEEPEIKKKRLDQTIKEMGNITSEVLKEQMMKLILTNPTLLSYCQNIKIAPFRETTRLLLDKEIKFLSLEEMGYILFHMKDSTERGFVKKRIIDFRKLGAKEKSRVIEEYKSTPEGNLTLVQAPTAGYWRQLCMNTGLFYIKDGNLYLREDRKEEARILLEKYGDEIYDFGSNVYLWNEYFTVPERIKQPIKIKIKLINVKATEYLVSVTKNRSLISGALIDGEKIFQVPLFPTEKYTIRITDLETGDIVTQFAKVFSKKGELLAISVPKKKEVIQDKQFYAKKIEELVSSSAFDSQYKRHLHIVGKYLKQDFMDPKHRAWLRGGRLEFLVYKLLEQVQKEGQLEDLDWNGQVDDFGIIHPAPGLRSGLPDISFRCDKQYYLLELTTIPSASAQWQAEGSSVPFHIYNFVNHTGIKDVVGIFSAPTIHEKVDDALKNTLIPRQYKIICISIKEFVSMVIDKKELSEQLKILLNEQYKMK